MTDEDVELALSRAETDRDIWRDTAQELRAEAAVISGILCDAGDDMVVEPLPEGVRVLCTQRNAAREMRRCAEDALAMRQSELAAVREAWEKERAGYDETTRVLKDDLDALRDLARKELADEREDHEGTRVELAEVRSEVGQLRAMRESWESAMLTRVEESSKQAREWHQAWLETRDELATLKSGITQAIADERAKLDEVSAFGGSVVVPVACDCGRPAIGGSQWCGITGCMLVGPK